MLVLGRKKGQSLIIGGNIKVTVLKMRGGLCKIGVEAPAGVSVNREEIQEQIDNGIEPAKAGPDRLPRRHADNSAAKRISYKRRKFGSGDLNGNR